MSRRTVESFADRRGRNVLLIAIAAIGFTAFAVTRPEANTSARPFLMMTVFLIACLVWDIRDTPPAAVDQARAVDAER